MIVPKLSSFIPRTLRQKAEIYSAWKKNKNLEKQESPDTAPVTPQVSDHPSEDDVEVVEEEAETEVKVSMTVVPEVEPVDVQAQLEFAFTFWNDFAARYTETANEKVTIKGAQELHAHLHLDKAETVLEVAAGAGIGALDILKYMSTNQKPQLEKKQLVVTDFAPAMVHLAEKTLTNASPTTSNVNIHVMEANGT